MFEAMRQAAFLAKLQTDGSARAARAARRSRWRRSTAPARSAWTAQIGSLEPGKRADLIAVSMAAARQTPMYDPLSHLVYVTRGDDVTTTIVNGRVLMRDRKVLTLNEADVLREARAMRRPGSRAAVAMSTMNVLLDAETIQARVRELAARSSATIPRARTSISSAC